MTGGSKVDVVVLASIVSVDVVAVVRVCLSVLVVVVVSAI